MMFLVITTSSKGSTIRNIASIIVRYQVRPVAGMRLRLFALELRDTRKTGRQEAVSGRGTRLLRAIGYVHGSGDGSSSREGTTASVVPRIFGDAQPVPGC